MKLYESIIKNLKEEENIQYSEEDNKKLEEIYNNLQAGISYGIDRDKEHFSWITYPYFDAVLYLIANNGVGREVIGWRNYGSSANPNTLEDLKWILDNIFEKTPTEFLNTYIKSTDSKLMESENTTLKEATGTKKFFITKFADNADRNGEEVEIVDYKDNGRLDIKFVSDGKLLKNVYDTEVKRVAYNTDGDNIKMITSDLGEYRDKIINYIKNLKETELKEMENSEGLTNIQFAEYCKDKLADLGTVKVKNFDDEDVDVKVAFEQPIRNYGTCKILDSEDTIDKLGSDGETLEFVDEKGEYHNSPMISPITLVGRCEFDRIDNNFYKSIIQYWNDIKDLFESAKLKEADGSRLLGGRYRTMSELRDLFKEYADHFETKGNRIKGNTPEDSYNRGWELGKADAYKLAAFEIENNVDPSLLGEAEDPNMNTTSLYIDIDELAKYAELYLQEKLGYAKVFKEPGKQYTYMLAIRRDDDSVDKWVKLHDGLFNESEILNEGNYGPAFVAEVLYDGTVGTCRGFGHTEEEAKENAFKLFKQVYPMALEDIAANALKHKGHLQDTNTEPELWQKLNNLIPNAASNDGTGTFTDEELIQFVEDWAGINVFDMSSGATNEGGNTLKESEEIETEEPAKQLWVYVSKHGLGPGTIPNDVEAQYVTSLPGTGKDIFSVSRELTPEELNKYELALFDNNYFAKYPEVVKELFSLNKD